MGLTGLRPSTGKNALSKSYKRKLEKKLNFISKVTEAVASLGTKKAIGKKKRLRSRQKKLKAYDLSSLKEFLPSVDALQKPIKTISFKVNCKSRQKLVEKEKERLRFVLNHPIFQADPISAIQQHLEQNQPPPIEVKSLKKSKKDRRRRSKKSPGMEAMAV